MGLVRLAGACTLLALALPGHALAAATWLPPVDLSGERPIPCHEGNPGSWTCAAPSEPSVGLSPGGHAVALWSEHTPGGTTSTLLTRVLTAGRSPAGAFAAPAEVGGIR